MQSILTVAELHAQLEQLIHAGYGDCPVQIDTPNDCLDVVDVNADDNHGVFLAGR